LVKMSTFYADRIVTRTNSRCYCGAKETSWIGAWWYYWLLYYQHHLGSRDCSCFIQCTVNFGILSTLISFSIIAPFVLFVLLRKAKIRKWNSVVLLGVYVAFLIIIYEVQIYIGGIYVPTQNI
jgi:hypothetical protein